MKKNGKVIQILGPIVDVRFPENNLPNLYNAIKINKNNKQIILEVVQHIGNDIIRTIALDHTEGEEWKR